LNCVNCIELFLESVKVSESVIYRAFKIMFIQEDKRDWKSQNRKIWIMFPIINPLYNCFNSLTLIFINLFETNCQIFPSTLVLDFVFLCDGSSNIEFFRNFLNGNSFIIFTVLKLFCFFFVFFSYSRFIAWSRSQTWTTSCFYLLQVFYSVCHLFAFDFQWMIIWQLLRINTVIIWSRYFIDINNSLLFYYVKADSHLSSHGLRLDDHTSCTNVNH